MSYRNLFFTLLVVFLGQEVLMSQTMDPIGADRPGAGDSPTITPKGYFQGEQGVGYEQLDKDNESFVLPNVLWKYGIFDNTELRLITDYVSNRSSGETTKGLAPITIGFKTKLTEEKGLLPLTSFIGHLTIPDLAAKDLKASYYAPSFGFLMHNSLTDKLVLDYNISASWDGESPAATFFYCLGLGYNFTETLGSFVEFYTFSPEGDEAANHNINYGLTYLLNQHMLLDLSSGIGLSDNASDYFVSFGFSYRINTAKE